MAAGQGGKPAPPPPALTPPAQVGMNQQIRERLSGVKYKIIVLSGKGGVGKSTVTANLAATLAKLGYSVGVFDYDFHGPAMARMLGVLGAQLQAFPMGIFPITGAAGVKVISLAFLLPDEKTPVIWRGPLKYKALQELMSNVIWGQLDFLLFDLPPGTGDEALNIAQNIPDITGAVVVTIPSVVSQVAVEKSAEFCKQLNVPLLGVIENMSYFRCPHCGEVTEIFGSGAGERIAEEEGIRLLGRLPLDPNVARCLDEGRPVPLCAPESETARAFEELAKKLVEILEKGEEGGPE